MKVFNIVILAAKSSEDAGEEIWQSFTHHMFLARDEEHARMKAMASAKPDPEVSRILVRPF